MTDPSWFERAFGRSVTDIRQKLVEEAWFGRTVTPRPLAEFGRSQGVPSAAEQLGWERPHSNEPSRQPTTPDPDRGIDR